MSKALEKKKQTVTEIAQKLRDSKTTVIADYRGLTVKQSNELRGLLREAGVELEVLKNTLTSRATKEVGLDLEEYLQGPSIFAFSKEDVVAPAKIIHNFSKENKALEIKGGIIEGKVVGSDQLKVLAEIPSKEGLLSMLLSVLQAPMRNLALAVKAVADKDESESA